MARAKNGRFVSGRSIYYIIDRNRWEPQGRAQKMNPTHLEIDAMYRLLRKDFITLLRQKVLRREDGLFKANLDRTIDGWFEIPLHGKRGYHFTLKDVSISKEVMKRNKDLLLRLFDWNDLTLFIKLLKARKVSKPKLTAQLIFAAWRHQCEPPFPEGHPHARRVYPKNRRRSSRKK